MSLILGIYPSLYLNIIMPAINRLTDHMHMPWVSALK
jgi:hypothetical protein